MIPAMQPLKHNSGRHCYTFIPTRAVFVFLSFIGIGLFYSYKVVLSVALVAMVGSDNTAANNESSGLYGEECPAFADSYQNAYTTGEFDWDSRQQAIILGGFFFGDILTQLPAGVLAERFGAKWIFGVSVLFSAIMSLVGPLAARTHFVLFFLTRFGQGLADGVAFPSMSAIQSRWVPKMERSRSTAIVFGVSGLGLVITLPLGGYLSGGTFLGGWPAIFYILGVAGVLWFVLWVTLIHETPDCHPHISYEEYNYIMRDQLGEVSHKRKPIPWKSIFTSIPLYALMITHFGQMWGFLTVLTLLPTYFTKILHLDITKNGLASGLPYLLNIIVGLISSHISDKIRKSGKVSVNVIRKVNNTIALMGPAFCMVAVVYAECDPMLSITYFALSIAFNGFGYSGVKSTHLDMAPDFAGTLMALTNTFAVLPGFLSPIVAAEFYSSGQTLTNWSYIFYLSAAIYVFATFIYIFFATAELQSWGVSDHQAMVSLLSNRTQRYASVDDRSKQNNYSQC